MSCHRLCLFFLTLTPSIPNPIAFISFSVLRHRSLCVSNVLPPFRLLQCVFLLFQHQIIHSFFKFFSQRLWASHKIIKRQASLPIILSLSPRLELIPMDPQSRERGSYVVACCQSPSHPIPNILSFSDDSEADTLLLCEVGEPTVT